MARTATIGPAVYERVSELTAQGRKRTEAFQIVAEERSMNPGTVSATYYRVARGQPTGSSGRRGRRGGRRSSTASARRRTPARRERAPTRSQGDGDLTTLANQIGDLVQQLVRQIEERDQRLRDLLG
jgi:hypothetical protein